MAILDCVEIISSTRQEKGVGEIDNGFSKGGGWARTGEREIVDK